MNKALPRWSYDVLAVVGVVLAASMLLTWIDFGGEFSARGITLAWNDNYWLFLVPIAGIALVATASARSEFTRLAALAAGVVVAGDVTFEVASSVIHAGLDTWLVLGGAGAILAGAAPQRTSLRAIGGLAVIAGFFAPWADFSMFKVLTSGYTELGCMSTLLWLVPAGGVLGVISAGNKLGGSKLALLAGASVFGALLVAVGSAAYAIFGVGAWAALGASATALVIGVVARVSTPTNPSKAA